MQGKSWEAWFESVAPFLNLFGTGNSALPSKCRQVLDYNNMEIKFIRKRAGKTAGGYQEIA